MRIISKFAVVICLLLLGACTAQLVEYTKSNISDQDLAVKDIEQVFYEQPAKHRPESIVVTDEYLGLNFQPGRTYVTD